MISSLVSFNKLAMENLSQNKLEMAYHFMHRAENILISLPDSREKASLTLITCNNQACLYKALGQSYEASSFLMKATLIDPSTPEDYFNLARCYLNLSLLKSEEKETDAALKHSLKALDLLSNHCDEDAENYYENLCTAFNIIGTQHKLKGNEEEATRVFKRGLDISTKFLGNSHQVTQGFLKVFEQKRYRFTKKPKSSGVSLPKMLNRAWPAAGKKEQGRRGSSFEFAGDEKNFKKRRVFHKESRGAQRTAVNNSVEVMLRKSQENFVPEKPKKKRSELDKDALVIQKAFRAFLVREQVEGLRNSKLTRRQLAEKKAIMALQEFEILKERAEKENPFYEVVEVKAPSKMQSRRSTARTSK